MQINPNDVKLDLLCETDGLDLINELHWNKNGHIFVVGSTKSPTEPGLYQLYLLQQKEKKFEIVKIEKFKRENS